MLLGTSGLAGNNNDGSIIRCQLLLMCINSSPHKSCKIVFSNSTFSWELIFVQKTEGFTVWPCVCSWESGERNVSLLPLGIPTFPKAQRRWAICGRQDRWRGWWGWWCQERKKSLSLQYREIRFSRRWFSQRRCGFHSVQWCNLPKGGNILCER